MPAESPPLDAQDGAIGAIPAGSAPGREAERIGRQIGGQTIGTLDADTLAALDARGFALLVDDRSRCVKCDSLEVVGYHCLGCGEGLLKANPDAARDLQARAIAARHPAYIETWRTWEVLRDLAQQTPENDPARGWAVTARQRASDIADAIVEDDTPRIERLARAALQDRAALLLGQLADAGFVYSPETFADLPDDDRALLTAHAAPYPVRWLFPRPTPRSERVLIPFHGPGGWSWGIREVLRATDVDIVGIDLDQHAVATAQAAGFEVILGDVTDLDPEHPALQYVTGTVPSPPCQGYTIAGLGKGRSAHTIDIVCGVVLSIPAAVGRQPTYHPDGTFAGLQHSGESWDEIREPLEEIDEDRKGFHPGLMAEVAVWAAAMVDHGSDLRWIAMEQSDRLPQQILDALVEALTCLGFATIETEILDAVVHGSPTHRKRLFMTAYLGEAAPVIPTVPARPIEVPVFASVVGWNEDVMVKTRGNRGIDPKTGRIKGGGDFPANVVGAPCVTVTWYSTVNSVTGERIGQPNLGRLVGFPPDYPWTYIPFRRGAEGIRPLAQLPADVVCPMTAAAVIGRVLNRQWETSTRAYTRALYWDGAPETAAPVVLEPVPAAAPRGASSQLALFVIEAA